MKNIKNVCVYCAHEDNIDTIYKKTAYEFGKILAHEKLNLVFGGGKVGLMGIIANGVIENGGHAVGFIPHYLDEHEGAHTGIQELHFVDNMHIRKASMFERADAFVILPGGFGTLDELFEIITWKQLCLHDKPIIIVNLNDYWSKLIDLMHHVIDEGFAKEHHRNIFRTVTRIEDIVPILRTVHDFSCVPMMNQMI